MSSNYKKNKTERDPLRYNVSAILVDKNLHEGRGEKLAIIDECHSITYQDLFASILLFSTLPELKTLTKQRIVICIFEDSIQAVVVFLGLIRMGLIPCFLNPRLTNEDYDFYIKNCNAVFALFSQQDLAKFAPIFLRHHIHFHSIEKDALNISFADASKKNISTEIDLGDETRPAFCLYTSGTTGHPSAVLHRHKDIIITNENYAKTILMITEQDVIFSTSKMFFAYGLNSICYALYHGATVILAPESTAPQWIWNILNKHNPTLFFSVPTVYHRLLQHKTREDQCESIRCCVSAGENLPAELRRSWQEATRKIIIDGIGTTEILSTFISNQPDDDYSDTTGKVVPGFEVALYDTNRSQVAPGEIGILWVKGDTYAASYLNHPEATAERFLDGWFNTGDLFSQDHQGYFSYHGRVSELIKSGAQWIYPYRIESVLNQHAAISECAIVGEKFSGLTRPVAYIILKSEILSSEKLIIELQSYAKEHCSHAEYPHFIRFVDALPRTATGKLQRYKLNASNRVEKNN